MTVILSATRYTYTSPFRTRHGIGDDAVDFPPSLTEQIDPDGRNAGAGVKAAPIRNVKETTDSRFELNLPYRSAFFNTADSNSDGTVTRDELSDTVTSLGGSTSSAETLFDQLTTNGTQALDEDQFESQLDDDAGTENPIDILASLLGGTG